MVCHGWESKKGKNMGDFLELLKQAVEINIKLLFEYWWVWLICVTTLKIM